MRSVLIAAIALATTWNAFAQDAAVRPDAAKSEPATKLEAFSARSGIVLIKGYKTIGVVNGMGRVSVDAREFRDASNPKQAQYGVAIEVKEAGRLERENTSYVDEDEVDSLLRGLEYISKIDRSVTTMGSFEAHYKTKGDFSLVVFSGAGSEVSFAVSSGRIGKTTAFLKLSDADQLKRLISEAKSIIATAKQAPR